MNINKYFFLLFLILGSCNSSDDAESVVLAIPEVETVSISNETETTVTVVGNVASDGGANISSKGICWSSTSQNPTITNSITNEGTGIGSFTSQLTGLNSDTTYYVRAYATNSEGTGYGSIITFNNSLPSVTTADVTDITQITANSGGEVTDEGGSSVLERGVCWSTFPNPTLNDNFTADGNGSGVYISAITGLNSDTTYYVRAYATNSIGTSYGNEIQFDNTEACYAANVGGVVTLFSQEDVDNFNYTSVDNLTIGDINGYSLSDITDLSPLSCLESVTEFTIVGNPSLQSLTGLESIQSIEDYLYIYNNDGLTNLQGLDNLESIGGSFIINNDGLINLEGLNNLQFVASKLAINRNNSLQTFQGLENLHTIVWSLNIRENISLTSIDGLSSLTSVGSGAPSANPSATIVLIINPLLTNLNILDNFGNGNNIYIRSCGSLTSVQCPSIIELSGLEFDTNDLLTDLDFSNLNNCVVYGVRIRRNSNLTDFCNFTNYANIAIANPANCEFIIDDNANNPSPQDIVDGNCN